MDKGGSRRLLESVAAELTAFFVFFVELGVAQPRAPSANESFEGDVSGTATIVSPGLPHVLYALLYVWLLPSGRGLTGLRSLGEVLHSNALHKGGYGTYISRGADVRKYLPGLPP